MSIRILKGSFGEHKTVESITTTVRNQMSWRDYYRGFGDLIDCYGNLIQSNFHLPYEGDNYGIYYSTFYLNSLVLTDINTVPLFAPDTTEEDDLTGHDLNELINVTYTWSNRGASDTNRTDQASSWKIRFEPSLQTQSLDNYINEAGGKNYWPDTYFTALNPQIKLPKKVDGVVTEVGAPDYGLYNDETDVVKQAYVNLNHENVPEIQKRVPNLIGVVTAYSETVKGAELAAHLGKINSVDFFHNVFTRKEEALIAKNKLPGYSANGWINSNDEGLWLMLPWTMEDLGNSFFEYEFFFEYNKNGWNIYDESALAEPIDIGLYSSVNFYDEIFAGMDAVLPNYREGR